MKHQETYQGETYCSEK